MGISITTFHFGRHFVVDRGWHTDFELSGASKTSSILIHYSLLFLFFLAGFDGFLLQ
jgi:hypothetical protein